LPLERPEYLHDRTSSRPFLWNSREGFFETGNRQDNARRTGGSRRLHGGLTARSAWRGCLKPLANSRPVSHQFSHPKNPRPERIVSGRRCRLDPRKCLIYPLHSLIALYWTFETCREAAIRDDVCSSFATLRRGN
jgi:hypothetical protein